MELSHLRPDTERPRHAPPRGGEEPQYPDVWVHASILAFRGRRGVRPDRFPHDETHQKRHVREQGRRRIRVVALATIGSRSGAALGRGKDHPAVRERSAVGTGGRGTGATAQQTVAGTEIRNFFPAPWPLDCSRTDRPSGKVVPEPVSPPSPHLMQRTRPGPLIARARLSGATCALQTHPTMAATFHRLAGIARRKSRAPGDLERRVPYSARQAPVEPDGARTTDSARRRPGG